MNVVLSGLFGLCAGGICVAIEKDFHYKYKKVAIETIDILKDRINVLKDTNNILTDIIKLQKSRILDLENKKIDK